MNGVANQRATIRPRRGDIVELTIDDWGDRGRGIARLGRMVVLTDHGLPGDSVRARITRRKSRHLEATVEEIIRPSEHRVQACCQHFGLCGGCRLLDLEYARQVEDKVCHMREQIRRIGGIDDIPDILPVPCDPPYRYRNKMEFSFGRKAGSVNLGLHPRGNYRDAFDLRECHLTDERAARIVAAVREFVGYGDEEPYDPVLHTGFLRFVVVRFGRNTGDVLVNVVTADRPWNRSDEFGCFLKKACPFVTTALWTVNASRANVAIGDTQSILFGSGQLTERLGPYVFDIASDGFFQTNTNQALSLFECVVRWVESDDKSILDLYSGAGAISLFLSQSARHVTGVESHAASVEAACHNAAANGVTNCTFEFADVLEYLRRLPPDAFPYDAVVLDPPRAGLHPKVVKALGAAAPQRIVYVSCNTSSLARDIALWNGAFRLVKLAAVDMFPHTPHIEAVALLESESTQLGTRA